MLKEQSVELREVVLGYMLLKKMKVNSSSEAMLLAATKGNLSLREVTGAIQAVFPEDKGGNHVKSKEVFILDEPDSHGDDNENDEIQEAMEAVVDEWQSREDADDEDTLEAYESYTDVRRRMAERK